MVYIFNRLSSYSTAKGSSTGLVPVGPVKVKARKSIVFTEGVVWIDPIMAFFMPFSHTLAY